VEKTMATKKSIKGKSTPKSAPKKSSTPKKTAPKAEAETVEPKAEAETVEPKAEAEKPETQIAVFKRSGHEYAGLIIAEREIAGKKQLFVKINGAVSRWFSESERTE
jgi:hypothetical protein